MGQENWLVKIETWKKSVCPKINLLCQINEKLRVPDIHEFQKHSFFPFCLIFLSGHNVSKICMMVFWPRVHRWKKRSQSEKNATWRQSWNWKCQLCKRRHFQFQLGHHMALLNFYTTFPIYGTLLKKVSFRFLICWVLKNFTEILLHVHVYQVSLKVKVILG